MDLAASKELTEHCVMFDCEVHVVADVKATYKRHTSRFGLFPPSQPKRHRELSFGCRERCHGLERST